MAELPPSPFVEKRESGFFLAETRISLDSVAYSVRRGETTDEIMADFPALKSREKLEGAVAYIKEHAAAIASHLAHAERRWESARELNDAELAERVRLFRHEKDAKSA